MHACKKHSTVLFLLLKDEVIMIKNWQKWFVCIFAVLFISVFFVYDAMFMNQSSGTTIPPIIAEEDGTDPTPDAPTIEIKPTETPNSPSEEKKDEVIPSYNNGYTCVNDALARLNNEKYKAWSFYSEGSSMGQVQKIQGTRYFNGNSFVSEVICSTDSSLGQNWYERIVSTDMSYFHIFKKAYGTGEKITNNIDGVTPRTLNYDGLMDKSVTSLATIMLIPTKGVDKLVKFDRNSSPNYYTVKFVFNMDKLLPDLQRETKKAMGASSLTYKSVEVEYQISKKTGHITKYMQHEIYDAVVYGISLQVDYISYSQLSVIGAPYEFPVSLD